MSLFCESGDNRTVPLSHSAEIVIGIADRCIAYRHGDQTVIRIVGVGIGLADTVNGLHNRREVVLGIIGIGDRMVKGGTLFPVSYQTIQKIIIVGRDTTGLGVGDCSKIAAGKRAGDGEAPPAAMKRLFNLLGNQGTIEPSPCLSFC